MHGNINVFRFRGVTKVLLVSAAVWALLEDLLHRGGGGGQRVGPLQTLQPHLVPPEHQPQLGTSPPWPHLWSSCQGLL